MRGGEGRGLPLQREDDLLAEGGDVATGFYYAFATVVVLVEFVAEGGEDVDERVGLLLLLLLFGLLGLVCGRVCHGGWLGCCCCGGG